MSEQWTCISGDWCFMYYVDKQVVLTALAVLRYRQGVSLGSFYGSGSDSYTDTGSSPFWYCVRQLWSVIAYITNIILYRIQFDNVAADGAFLLLLLFSGFGPVILFLLIVFCTWLAYCSASVFTAPSQQCVFVGLCSSLRTFMLSKSSCHSCSFWMSEHIALWLTVHKYGSYFSS